MVTLLLRFWSLPLYGLADLVDLACRFSHLRTLDIRYDTAANLLRPTSSNLSTHLRHLTLDVGGGGGATPLLEWFISLADPPALRTLDSGSVDEAGLDIIVRICSLLEDTLESLSFVLYRNCHGGTLSVFIVDNLIDLRCTGLGLHCQIDLGRIRSLRIRLNEAPRRLVRQIPRTIWRISSIHIDEIVLELHPSFHGEPNPLAWRITDTVLQQPAFSRLSKFEIHFLTCTTTFSQIPAEELLRFLIRNLPQCNARGILCVSASA